MATSKVLAPTNVTIQIPEFTDQPDQRVNSNCLDKEADAINALNSKFALFGMKSKAFQLAANATSETFDAWAFVLFGVKNSADNSNNRFCYYGTSLANNARGGYISADVSWVGISFNATTQKLTITNNGTSYGSFVLFYADT